MKVLKYFFLEGERDCKNVISCFQTGKQKDGNQTYETGKYSGED